ncbi:MAG: hypothetical protein HY424_01815 [Candidatus Levybacteria bacterium]|nr:hypothetical protein [Candidatus Levybacteria bacterium]
MVRLEQQRLPRLNKPVLREKTTGLKDFGEQEVKGMHALFELNDKRDGFQYTRVESLVMAIYGKKIADMSDPKAKAKIVGDHIKIYFPQLQRRIIKQLKTISWPLSSDDIPGIKINRRRLAKTLEWLIEQPEYTNVTLEELIPIIERKLPFDRLRRKVTGEKEA